MDRPGIGLVLIYMFVEGIVFFILTIVIQVFISSTSNFPYKYVVDSMIHSGIIEKVVSSLPESFLQGERCS